MRGAGKTSRRKRTGGKGERTEGRKEGRNEGREGGREEGRRRGTQDIQNEDPTHRRVGNNKKPQIKHKKTNKNAKEPPKETKIRNAS